MKRILCCITILVLIFSLFLLSTSCAKTDSSNDGEKLKYYTSYESTNIIDIIERYNKYCKNNFDESYQIEIVKYETADEMYTKMSAEIMAGGGPDIISSDQPLPFEKLMGNQVFADVDEIINKYNSNINFDDCNTIIMEAGINNGHRYFVPLFYAPNILVTTQENLNKYNLNNSEFSYTELSQRLMKEQGAYSLFGDKSSNNRFFYSYLNSYMDFNNKTMYFDTDEFIENIDYFKDMVENDSTDENIYYDLYNSENNICLFSTPKYLFGGTISAMKTTYYNIILRNKTPIILPNCNKDNAITAYVECGVAINQNSDKKDKALKFIEYCLSEDIQEYWCGSRKEKGFSGTNVISLPVNNEAFKYAVKVETDTEWDHNEDGKFDENEREFSSKVDSMFWADYLSIIDGISECSLYNYNYLENNYYNSSVIGEKVNKYLSGDISKDKFIRQLTTATEIYLTE